jgi:L-amino acid N-acyltransferase YncA
MDPCPFVTDLNALTIRSALETEIDSVTGIYAWHVLNGAGTFEIVPHDVSTMQQRFEDVTGAGCPWLVALTAEGHCAGFAYANWIRPREGFKFCWEDSIYLHPDHIRRGIGKLLLNELIRLIRQTKATQLVAVIGDSGNAASIKLHESCGFKPCGMIHQAGWKFERWWDVVLMQLDLQ